ncbi:Rad21_Rec8 domain-containing protein/Rad21_Rec8_N domain-containing protein [Cephalotus follicularis]|uniref:Rad21_Rec8 domain-containing protein/Rad21_Rec8_N domain-containing protein n=1 Tax=Cephalotus follicularis TaxID=3775 RepID=A0A1Q3CZQ2_CEPFO|nr:Rad21_Rec8 domain-containing protein/Rad21_Rec8_N domain-containing protein [Cephalotus follicularis]
MFYSHTFLARKGPLGTVWCAAHLQHRLKKSHYLSTDICATVDRIMVPEVPIALRLSGHLLLGVVRIYSKKVDYLFHDCNVILIGLTKTFPSMDLNLPEDRRQAKDDTITLPATFDLDALELNDETYHDGTQDNHLRDQEDITLLEQIPGQSDPYVVITFDDDIMVEFSRPEEVPDAGVRPMDEDIHPPPMDKDVGFSGLDSSNQAEMDSFTTNFQDPGKSNETQILTGSSSLQDPGPSNETEIGRSSLPDPGPSNQTEVLPESLALRDPGPSNQIEVLSASMGFRDPGPGNQIELLNRMLSDGRSPQNIPEIEVMRDSVNDFSFGNLPPVCPDQGNEPAEVNISSDRVMNKEILSSILEDVLTFGEQSLPFQQRSEAPVSATSKDGLGTFDIRVSLGHSSPDLAIRSTPLQQPRPRKRKRRLYDESTVLSNAFMKKALNDTSDLVQRRRVPCSALGVWKLHNFVRKEKVFDEPLLTGMSSDLCNMFTKDYIITKPHLLVLKEAVPETIVPQSPAVPETTVPQSPAVPETTVPQSPASATEAISDPGVAQSTAPATEANPETRVAQSPPTVPENDMEIERLRDDGYHDDFNLPSYFMPSNLRNDDFTPTSTNSLGLESVAQAGASTGTVLATPEIAASTGTYGSDFETPRTFFEDQLGLENTGLSDIPELRSCGEAEDLYFLETDNNTPTGTQTSLGVESLSVRTRAVAQYLLRQSSITPVAEDRSGDLSLHKILEGKRRKLCARMFFETLVLKSYGLVDVQQEQPYGDITLKLTPILSKAQI